MENNPRIIEMGEFRRAIRRMSDIDEPQAQAADRLLARARRAYRLEGVDAETGDILKREAAGLGIPVLDGMPGPQGASARILVTDDESLRRLAGILESLGERGIATALRSTLACFLRSEFAIAWADGARLELGGETRVMGVLNVTPDSFSDGGKFSDPAVAVEAAGRMAEAGAVIVDVGGESTRPGAEPVPDEEQIKRVVPVIGAIKHELGIRVSVDTTRAAVARRALAAGADMINDISGFSDPAMTSLIGDTRVPVVIMHMRGTPRTMQLDTQYVDLLSSVIGFLRKTVEKAVNAGISDDKILVDPGLGFGKSSAGNLQILRELPSLRSVGRPLLIGASRKSFIGAALNLPTTERLEGSLAVAALAAWQGVHVIRAHDVPETIRVVRMIGAIRGV